MRTYTEVFSVPEYRTLFGTNCLTMAASTLSGLALGSVTFAATGSPLLTALAMFGAPLASVVGSLTLLSAADSVPPRRAMVTFAAAGTVTAALQAVPGLPLWLRFALLIGTALVSSVTSGAKWALVSDVLPPGAYLLGRSTLNISVGVMQIVGYGVGGLLLLRLLPAQLFLVSAAASAAALVWLRLGLAERPPRSTARLGLAQTLRVNRQLWSGRVRRPIFLSLWVPNGLIVGCEAMFVPYAGSRGGYLLAAAALGMLAGDVVVGRFVPPRLRDRLIWPLRFLLGVPYPLFLVHPPLALAAVAAALASFGFAASLPLQDRLLRHSPPEVRGHVLGLHGNGNQAMQAVGATIAGVLAEWIPVSIVFGIMAMLSLAATALLTGGLRLSNPDGAAEERATNASAGTGAGTAREGSTRATVHAPGRGGRRSRVP